MKTPVQTRLGQIGSLLQRHPDILIAGILIVYAGVFGVRVTRDLSWPYDMDHFRDMAFSQTMAQGNWLSDPYYRGEYLWYNPLVPAIAATITKLGDLSVHVVYARLGAYLNLLAPVAFFWLVRSTLGSLAAVAATVVFIFAAPRGAQGWNTATYSPWLFPGAFAQALFYAGLLSLHRLGQNATFRNRVVAGVLLGLTFLAHTAPAIILVGVLLAGSGWTLARGRRTGSRMSSRRAVMDVAVILGLTVLISVPLTWAIVGHYRLHVVNNAPRSWVFELLLIENLRDLLYTHATVATGFALVGLVPFLSRRGPVAHATVFRWWGLVNVLLFLRGYAAQASPTLARLVPPLVPEFHYLFYLRALLAVCAGLGFVVVARWLTLGFRFRPRRAPGITAPVSRNASDLTTTVGYVLIVVIASQLAPRLGKRYDFGSAIREAHERQGQLKLALYDWIRRSTPVDSVFLAPDDLVQFVIGPSGRKAVAVYAAFSNPYLDHRQRARDRDEMYAMILANDEQGFCDRAKQYQVTHVVLDEEKLRAVPPRLAFVDRTWTGDGVQVWAVLGCRGTSPPALSTRRGQVLSSH